MLRSLTALLVLGFVFFGINARPLDNDGGLQVTTKGGVVLGQFETGYRVWRGIPYAQATRWSSPEPPASWETVRTSVSFGAACPQNFDIGVATDEDCQFINIWAPPVQDSPCAVMVFIHGGSFVTGAGSQPLFDGGSIANSTNTILITFNYRLGVLGFLAGADGFEGNYGFLDQQAALNWVQQNIAAFGGDPNQVTLFGQSAGAMSVFYHLTAPNSKGLFQKAIIESNPTGVLLRTVEQNQPWFRLVSELLECPEVGGEDCLLNKTVTEILNAQRYTWDYKFPLLSNFNEILSWLPSIDGVVLPGQPLSQVKNGNWSNIPVLVGTTVNETVSWTFSFDPKIATTVEEYKLVLEVAFENKTLSEEAFQLYPAYSTGNQVREALAELSTDFAFGCPTFVAANYMVASNPNNIYTYLFDYSPRYDPVNPFPACWNNSNDDGSLGFVCHESELPFVFNSGNLLQDPFDSQEQMLSKELMGLWTSFANGTFNQISSLPFWQPYQAELSNSIVLTVPSGNTTFFRQQKCNFWNSLNYY